MKKAIFISSLVLNLVCSYFIAKRFYYTYLTTKPSSSKTPNSNKITYWLNRNQVFEVLPKDSNSIVFLGNSLTQNFELAEIFKNTNIKNRGINGDIIEGVQNRLTPIIETKPKKIFIEIGINDLGIGIPKDKVIFNYLQLIDRLISECKSTKIYINSLFPVEVGSDRFPTYCNEKVNKAVVEINEELLRYSKDKNITYIDTYSKFELNGQLDPKYSVDGIHLTGEGYLLWSDILRPYINE
jgi:lysophospholipase L1-like esterase